VHHLACILHPHQKSEQDEFNLATEKKDKMKFSLLKKRQIKSKHNKTNFFFPQNLRVIRLLFLLEASVSRRLGVLKCVVALKMKKEKEEVNI
jgi:hypothetical protein